MKDLFVGSLGRANNHGGSRMCAIPHTIGVEPDYEIETDVPSVAEFVTCSLDGRLWLFRRARRYYISALKPNNDTERLEFAVTQAVSNDNFITRGLDWILTDKHMITHSDNSPYLNVLNLFTDSKSLGFSSERMVEHCYSLLPQIGDYQLVENFLIRKSQGSNMLCPILLITDNAADIVVDYNILYRNLQFTYHDGQIWAINHNSCGKVYLAQAPSGQGNIPRFFLNIGKDLPTPAQVDIREYVSFQKHTFAFIQENVSWEVAKTACENLGGHLATSTSAEKDIFLYNLANGDEVWLGGTDSKQEGIWEWITGEDWSYTNWDIDQPDNYMGIQDALTLRTNGRWDDKETFITQGDYGPIYYICEWDYPISTITSAFLGDTLYGYELKSANNLCHISNDTKVFDTSSGQWNNLSNNTGNIFFDTLHSRAVLLDDKGANLLNDKNIRFDCNALSQWVAPAKSIDAIDDSLVIASDSNGILATHINAGFFRERLSSQLLPLTCCSYYGKKLSMGNKAQDNKKFITVNQIESVDVNVSPISWYNIYR